MGKTIEDKSQFKGKVHEIYGACADYADKFMDKVIRAESPLELAEMFYENVYLREDMNGSARIFNETLDFSTTRSGVYHLAEDKKLIGNIYALAFFDYAKKHNLLADEEADEMARKEVELK